MSLFGIFNTKAVNNIKSYLEKGAIVLDVRTQAEWDKGHIKNAKHIALNLIPLKLEEIKKLNKPIIAVCKSGGRSQQATQFLAKNGVDIMNGGSWQNVAQYV